MSKKISELKGVNLVVAQVVNLVVMLITLALFTCIYSFLMPSDADEDKVAGFYVFILLLPILLVGKYFGELVVKKYILYR